jgi:hypothetical protein
VLVQTIAEKTADVGPQIRPEGQAAGTARPFPHWRLRCGPQPQPSGRKFEINRFCVPGSSIRDSLDARLFRIASRPSHILHSRAIAACPQKINGPPNLGNVGLPDGGFVNLQRSELETTVRPLVRLDRNCGYGCPSGRFGSHNGLRFCNMKTAFGSPSAAAALWPRHRSAIGRRLKLRSGRDRNPGRRSESHSRDNLSMRVCLPGQGEPLGGPLIPKSRPHLFCGCA